MRNAIFLILFSFIFLLSRISAQQAGLSVTPEILTSGIITGEGFGYAIDGYYQFNLSKILFLRIGLNYEIIAEQSIPAFAYGGGIYDILYPQTVKTNFAKAGIPMIIGVHLNSFRPLYPKFKYYLYTGYLVSVALPSRTIYYYPNSREKSEKQNNYKFYLDEKLIQSFMIGLDFSFQVDENLSIYFSPEFKNTFIDFSMADQTSFGLKLGARYRFPD